MTYWLLGTIISTTLFILTRFTSFKILEEEDDAMFKKSPNLAKLGVMTVANSAVQNGNEMSPNGKESELNDTQNAKNTNNIHEGATLLLKELVSEAASAAINKSKLQDFDNAKI